jgi:glycosyltransferase involved in cell wall biosynthesis
MLFEYMAAEDLAEVQVLSPSRWGSERGKTVHAHNYHHECLETMGQSISSFRLRGLEDYIREFKPGVLYVMEEPYTPFALHCTRIAEKYNIPMAIFTWENVSDRRFGDGTIENGVIDSASVIIAGNEGAKQRLILKGAAEDKVAVCPQTGIDTAIFKPMPDVEKTHDVTYIGRMVKEKGIEYIENAVKRLNLNMLWVGGRGDLIPSYGVYVGWINYLNLPEYYNKTKLFVTYPYAYNGYSEQANYTIGEAIACGTPVISSSNGSIGEVYKDAPILFAEAANEAALSDAIKSIFDNPRETQIEEGIKWVSENLCVPVIARRLVDILENERK